jgi:uncharacterized LabA/DUF88 family protein
MSKKVWLGLGILIVILIILGFYFTQINNIFADKKNLEKPSIDLELLSSGGQVIFGEHIDYLTNEIGAYKLHSYGGENAIIIFEMTDIDKKIALIKNGESYVSEDIPEKYDLIIKGEQIVVAELIESENLNELLSEYVEQGKISVELVSDMTTLSMKGFLGIYDELSS